MLQTSLTFPKLLGNCHHAILDQPSFSDVQLLASCKTITCVERLIFIPENDVLLRVKRT
jgi:hypothetical protein